MTAAQFRLTRIRLGLTQGQLAKELGYKRYETIGLKERGARTITKRDELAIRALKERG